MAPRLAGGAGDAPGQVGVPVIRDAAGGRHVQGTGRKIGRVAHADLRILYLLPESEVVAPGGQVPDSPPSRPKRKESTSQDEASESQASADDPIAQVIAANTTQSSEASADEPEIEADGRYMLQAASFRSTADARQLADRLKNFGLLANITEVKTGDGTTWHRVQAGPYTDRNELTRAQDLMVTQASSPC